MRDSGKKSGLLKKIICILAVFVLGNAAAAIAGGLRITKKMKQHEKAMNMMHSIVFGKSTVELDEDSDADNIYLNCMSGQMNLDITRPITHDINIDITSLFGNVVICLPLQVNVVIDGVAFGECLNNVIPDYEEEGLPVVHITRHSFLSRVSVQAMVTWEA